MLAAVSGGRPTRGETPRVSVVMAVCNGERFVREAIESLRSQTLEDFELIVVDDGSTDATPRIVEDLAARRRPHPARHSQSNTGYPDALNVGWRLARGEYVAILDADDLAEPGRLERQLVYLDEHPDVGVVGGALLLVTADGRPFYVASYPTAAAGALEGLQTHCPVGHTAVLMRRSILEEVGGYRSTIPLAEDYDLWLRVSERYPIVNLPDIVGRYRMHGDNESHAHPRRGGIDGQQLGPTRPREGTSRSGAAEWSSPKLSWRSPSGGPRSRRLAGTGWRGRREASLAAGARGSATNSRSSGEQRTRPATCAKLGSRSDGAPREFAAASPPHSLAVQRDRTSFRAP